MIIHLRNVQVVNQDSQNLTVEIPCQPLPPEEVQVLDRLFPHTYERMKELLAVEALLASVDSAECSEDYAPPAKY